MRNKLNLKIYGITTVGSKGQVIIPKDCREDFDVKLGDFFCIITFDKKAFGIGKGHFKDTKKTGKTLDFDIKNSGNIKIGTKFQFVIPNNVRNDLNIEPGDSLIVVGKQKSSKGEGIGFIKNDDINFLLDYIKYYTKN